MLMFIYIYLDVSTQLGIEWIDKQEVNRTQI